MSEDITECECALWTPGGEPDAPALAALTARCGGDDEGAAKAGKNAHVGMDGLSDLLPSFVRQLLLKEPESLPVG
jgi:hypothetical protein